MSEEKENQQAAVGFVLAVVVCVIVLSTGDDVKLVSVTDYRNVCHVSR